MHGGTLSGGLTIRCDLMLWILTELEKVRPLTDSETDIVEEIVTRETQPFAWSPQLDGDLLVAADRMGGIRRFAERHGITNDSAYARLVRLRRRKEPPESPSTDALAAPVCLP